MIYKIQRLMIDVEYNTVVDFWQASPQWLFWINPRIQESKNPRIQESKNPRIHERVGFYTGNQ